MHINFLSGAKIDGEYFLSILKGELSLEIEVSPGFKFHLNKNKQKVCWKLMSKTSSMT